MSIKIALAGNPNCGKTTLFNALTGSNQFVGNWPGVTVEKKEGRLKGHKDVIIMDLPGIYSLSPYTLEEVVARNYLINERPDAIINIVDGTNLERNLYLSTQIMELGIPVVMAVNMMDLVQKTGNKIYIDKLSKKLGCEVVEISALKGEGIEQLIQRAVAIAKSRKKIQPAHMAIARAAPQIQFAGGVNRYAVPGFLQRQGSVGIVPGGKGPYRSHGVDIHALNQPGIIRETGVMIVHRHGIFHARTGGYFGSIDVFHGFRGDGNRAGRGIKAAV